MQARVLTRKLCVGITWDIRRDNEDPDGSTVGIELGGDIVVRLSNKHLVFLCLS